MSEWVLDVSLIFSCRFIYGAYALSFQQASRQPGINVSEGREYDMPGVNTRQLVCIPLYFLVWFARYKHQRVRLASKPTYIRGSEVIRAPGMNQFLEAVRIGKKCWHYFLRVLEGNVTGPPGGPTSTAPHSIQYPFQTADRRPQQPQHRLPRPQWSTPFSFALLAP